MLFSETRLEICSLFLHRLKIISRPDSYAASHSGIYLPDAGDPIEARTLALVVCHAIQVLKTSEQSEVMTPKARQKPKLENKVDRNMKGSGVLSQECQDIN